MRTALAACAAFSVLLVATDRDALATAPIIRHDCALELSTRPRPCDGDVDITRRTSIYFELALPLTGHYPTNGIDLNSVVLTLTPAGGSASAVYGPNQVSAPGWTGTALPFYTDGSNWIFGFEIVPESPLLAATTYTATVDATTKQGEPVDPATATWTFTTRRDLSGAVRTLDIDLASPTVHWPGRWFGGTAKVTFDTSRLYELQAVYALMDEVRVTAPEFFIHHRDTPWTGDSFRNTYWDGNPNIYRELETRRITSFTNTATSTILALTDFVEHGLYGIPSGRPLSLDYQVGERVLVCDADQSEVRTILAIDDVSRRIEIERLEAPIDAWNPGDPAAGPADSPSVPDHFTVPLAALRKYERPGTPRYYWTRVEDELDQHVASGRKPLVRINDVPVDLCATGLPANPGGGECQNVPKDWVAWDRFVYDVVVHLIDRYGPGVATWYFAIGNENTLSPFWKTRFNDFFDYYDVTSNAMLRAFEDRGLDSHVVMVGGVEDAPAGNRHLEEVAYHCAPDVDNPTAGYDETNLVCTDSRFDGLRSSRVEALCAAHGNKGCPFDYYSIHPYRHAREAHELVKWGWDRVHALPTTFYDEFQVNCHETGPDWMPQKDPAALNVFAASGYFSTWGADFFQRLLADAMLDPRRARGETTLTTWGFNWNFADGTQSVASVMRVDADGDGTQDDVAAAGNYFFRFVELAARMSHHVAALDAVEDAGLRIGGWRSVEAHGDRILLYSHDRLDPDHREDGGHQVVLNLSNLRFPEVDVTEYRLDRDHGTRAAYDALPKRGAQGVYTPAELAALLEADRLVPLGPPVRHVLTAGALTLETFVQGQGITWLAIDEVDPDGDGVYPADDNCPAIGNPGQDDGDADGAGDVCDCAPADATAYAVPPAIASLGVSGGAVAEISWEDLAAASGSGTRYDLAAGEVSMWRAGTAPGGASCLGTGLSEPAYSDVRLPPPGDGSWYLARGVNACGAGPYGNAELDADSPCP